MRGQAGRKARIWGVLTLALWAQTGWTLAQARSVAIGGVVQAAAVQTRLVEGSEMMAVWTLPRLGIQVRNDPQDVRLRYGSRELRFSPAQGWRAVGLSLPEALPVPGLVGGSLHVPLAAVNVLGVRVLADTADVLDFATPAALPSETLPPSAPLPAASAAVSPSSAAAVLAHLDTVRVSRSVYRNVEVQRVVLELSGLGLGPKEAPPLPAVSRDKAGLSVALPVTATPSTQTLASGDTLRIEGNAAGSVVWLGTGGGKSEVFTLPDPPRVVIDTTTVLDPTVPPPVNPQNLPSGVSYLQRGGLHLLSFDPQLYQAQVVSAPLGRASDIASLVGSVGGVAGINGNYFDTATLLPVDLVVSNGMMLAPSLEKRATVGFGAAGLVFGYPKPRYVLSGNFGTLVVNTVGAKVRRDLLTAFVGDGKTAVGDGGLTTLYAASGSVQQVRSGANIPPKGTLALTFDAARFPKLLLGVGEPLTAELAWRGESAWTGVPEALSAGPLLVQGGRVALNPGREGFKTSASIWRATRQVAVGVLGGKPTLAYFEYGTPEAFAAALAAAGVSDAVRMDSGSSASAYLTAGFGDLGGYLNTVWSQKVPNAVVIVSKATKSAAATMPKSSQ